MHCSTLLRQSFQLGRRAGWKAVEEVYNEVVHES
jgi:hypothetical protein